MRFTPTAQFGIAENFTEECITARGTNCTSGSFYSGPVIWEWFDYTASANSTASVELSQFIIDNGITDRAVVLTVGGGGGGAGLDDGGGGGAGGVGLRQGITLEPGTYTVGVGGGGGGTRGSLNPADAEKNGADGNPSYFVSGGINLSSGGGEGGFAQEGTLSKAGGRSGENYSNSFANGNTSFDSAGGAGARSAVTSSSVKPGFGFYFDFGTVADAVGGGGESILQNTGNAFGGGGYRPSFYPPGDARNASGGGGGSGISFRNSDNTYWTSNGGNGRVIVVVPTNLCSGSLYTTSTVDRAGLTQWIDFNNGRTFGKNFTGYVFEDIIRPKQNMFPTNDISPANSGSYLEESLQYTSSFGLVSTNFSASNFPYSGLEYINSPGQTAVVNSQIPNFNLADDFSLEWCGYQKDATVSPSNSQIFGIITGSNDPDDAVSPFVPYLCMRLGSTGGAGTNTVVNLLKEFEPVSSTASLDINVAIRDSQPTQYVITYDASERLVSLYNEGDFLVGLPNVEFPSTYYNQWAPFMDDQRDEVVHKEIRLYNRVISTSSMEQNYTASFGPPPECIDGQEFRFTAGGSDGTATYTRCGYGFQTVEIVPAGTSIDRCLTSGSIATITGVGASLVFLGTCT